MKKTHKHSEHDCSHCSYKETSHRVSIIIIVLSSILLALSLIYRQKNVSVAISISAFAIAGYEVLWSAVKNLISGKIFDENFLMSLATLGAIGLGEYTEAVAVMLLYKVGELFQSIAVGRSRQSIEKLSDMLPHIAHVERNGETLDMLPEQVQVGDILTVRVGERVPVDGSVISDIAYVDTSALTGESLPRTLHVGESVLSGSICNDAVFKMKAEKPFRSSAASRVLELVEESAEHKSKSESFISRFAGVYTPAVVIGALLLAVVPSVITGNASMWIHRALTFLVVSCPCALVISVPLTFFAGIGGAARHGILIKGSCFVETLARTDTFIFDKTGTLTEGAFEVACVSPVGCSEEELLFLAAVAEENSNHPVASAIKRKMPDTEAPFTSYELTGEGVVAECSIGKVAVGNSRLMAREGISAPASEDSGTTVYVAKNGEYMGFIAVSDRIKANSKEAIERLKKQGIANTSMLTGDLVDTAKGVAEKLGIDDCRAELLPKDKLCELERIMEGSSGKVAYVGDGINDAPVITRADVGFAMGALGSDAAVECADIVLSDDDPLKLPEAVRRSRRTLGIARQNVVIALTVKASVLALGALGISGMWAAVIADVGVTVLAVVNAMRAMK